MQVCYTKRSFRNHQAPVVQRVDNFIHWISPYRANATNQLQLTLLASFPHNPNRPILKFDIISTLSTNYRAIGKILHTFHLVPVVQRADNFIHWISRYPAEQMYSNQRFWQVFHAIPYLNLTYASTQFTNFRIIGKILLTFYLPN